MSDAGIRVGRTCFRVHVEVELRRGGDVTDALHRAAHHVQVLHATFQTFAFPFSQMLRVCE